MYAASSSASEASCICHTRELGSEYSGGVVSEAAVVVWAERRGDPASLASRAAEADGNGDGGGGNKDDEDDGSNEGNTDSEDDDDDNDDNDGGGGGG